MGSRDSRLCGVPMARHFKPVRALRELGKLKTRVTSQDKIKWGESKPSTVFLSLREYTYLDDTKVLGMSP